MPLERRLGESDILFEGRMRRLVETILDTIVDGVITIDENGIIQSYNKACIKLFGYRQDEAMGRNINMLLPAEYQSEHGEYFKKCQENTVVKMAGGKEHEISGRHKDGTVFPMELSVGKTTDGGLHAYIGIVRDVSELREGEKARELLRQSQKMEALGQLTGGIAHDFNNLLAIILGNLDYMTEYTGNDDPLRSFINPSIEAAEHGANLTKQLLAFSRKQALMPKNIAVDQMLNDFTSLVRHTLGERIEIILAPTKGAWNINVDPSQLQNALLNLAVNARDAMANGGKLILETENVYLDQEYAQNNTDVIPGEYVIISITDTGEGMSPEVIEKAFEPFFTTKDVGKGSGLGLSMVYGFVKQSRGHVKIYSEINHGTTIRLYLPRSDSSAPAAQEPIRPVSTGKKAKLVLVVEDNKNVLKLTSAMVESLGYDILTAETGDAAKKILDQRADIDLLLTDVMLPGATNGPVLANYAVSLYPKIKILFNSGYAEHAILQTGILDEDVQLISKPFRKPQLAAKIEEVLKL